MTGVGTISVKKIQLNARTSYSLVFAKNTSVSRYLAGVLTKYSAHGGILGKDG